MSSKEPAIVINGTTLSSGQSMTVRVALESFATDLHESGLGNDDRGKQMAKAYLANIDTIRQMMYRV